MIGVIEPSKRLFGFLLYGSKLVFFTSVGVSFPQNTSVFLEKLPCQSQKILRLTSKHQNPNSL